jgi:uncharacterized membrane protein YfcA
MVIAAAAALAAGMLNALAGGGTLLLYPALVALGLPPIVANFHCSMSLCPGYLGAALAQRQALAEQRVRWVVLVPIALAGGVAGALLLLRTRAHAFEQLVPWLILLASLTLAAQDSLAARFIGRGARDAGRAAAVQPRRLRAPGRWYVLLPILLAAVYAGYFGAGVSVLLLALLGLAFDDTFTRLNALKQALGLAATVGAVGVFAVRASVHWPLVALLAGCALLGGFVGGQLAARVRPARLRRIVVVLGVALAAYYFTRLHVAAQS